MTSKTVQNVLEHSAINNIDDPNPFDYSFPESILSEYIGKQILFKVKLRDLNVSYGSAKFSVMSICTDQKIISKFKMALVTEQVCVFCSSFILILLSIGSLTLKPF